MQTQPVPSLISITARLGEVIQEEGLEITSLTGYISVLDTGWVMIFGDPELPALEQPHSLIPQHRIVRIEFAPAA